MNIRPYLIAALIVFVIVPVLFGLTVGACIAILTYPITTLIAVLLGSTLLLGWLIS